MNVWPDDDFSAGSTAYGTAASRYVRIRPAGLNTTVPGIGILSFDHGSLFDGHVAGKAASLPGPGVVTDDVIVSAVERVTDQEFGEVRADPALVAQVAPGDFDAVRGFFLWARVNGGTLTTPGSGTTEDEYHDLPSAIYFAHVKLPGTRSKLIAGYLVAGSFTSIGDVIINEEVAPVGQDFPDMRRMRLVLESNGGGGTVVKCYRIFPQVSSPTQPSQIEVLVFEADIGGSGPTGAGRWGFGMQVFKDQASGSRFGVVVDSLKLYDVSGGLVFRDEFQRTMPGASRSHTTTQLTPGQQVSGRSLMSAWTGDLNGVGVTGNPPHIGHLARSGDLLSLGADVSSQYGYGSGAQNYGWYVSQTPEPFVDQRRSVVANFVGAPSVRRQAGIFLRGGISVVTSTQQFDLRSEVSPGHAGELDYFKTGYMLVLEYDGVSAWELRIDHFEYSELDTYRAETIASLVVAGPTLGAAQTLDFEIRSLGSFGAAVAMRARLNAGVQTLVPQLAEVTEEDDWIIDARSVATQQGSLSGLFFQTDSFSAGSMTFDSWHSETLSDPPGPSGDDQPSIPLDAEDANLSGALTTPMAWPVKLSYINAFRDHRSTPGYRQRIPKFDANRRRWRVGTKGITSAERAEVMALRASNGSSIPFSWTDGRTGDVISVRFVGPVIPRRYRSHGRNAAGSEEIDFTLEEVFGASILNPIA